MRAVLFDMGGVLTTSPFENFAAYERAADLPDGFIRQVNATRPDTNAWARFERGELDRNGFVSEFEREAAALGHAVDGGRVLGCLEVDLRPEVIDAVRRVQAGPTLTALLTNNTEALDLAAVPAACRDVFEGFDTVVESCLVGVRKPDPRFFRIACERLGVRPDECLFLDDLGVNLKAARAMGMETVKIESADQVVAVLKELL